MNTHQKLVEFINSCNDDIITRKEIVAQNLGWHVTIDNYRNWLTKSGYLNHISRGIYKRIKLIDKKLSNREIRKLAYPHYKDWSEYRNKI